MVAGFAFAGSGPDELAGGRSPFLVTYTGARALQDVNMASTLQEWLLSYEENPMTI
jgi:hypothetical protein